MANESRAPERVAGTIRMAAAEISYTASYLERHNIGDDFSDATQELVTELRAQSADLYESAQNCSMLQSKTEIIFCERHPLTNETLQQTHDRLRAERVDTAKKLVNLAKERMDDPDDDGEFDSMEAEARKQVYRDADIAARNGRTT